MSIAKKSIAVLAIIAVTIAVVYSFVATLQVAQAAALTDAQIQSIVSLLQSFGADSTTIANVQASLQGLPTSGSGSSTTGGSCAYTFTQTLQVGSTGAEVMNLQKFLNMDSATQVAASGAGSPGNETSTFGPATKAAVIKFQNKYASDVLAPVGLSSGTGYWGASSRAKANMMCSSGSTSGGTTVPSGTGLNVSAPAQPANALAPQGATRVPFTKFTLTAGNDGDVVVNSVVVQRVGFGSDASFSGIVLLDDMGKQLGTSKTFNSNHQATIGETMTIPRGQSRTFTVAANMNTSLSSYAGEAPAISVVSINTTATVSGSLPITGAYDTINSTLTTAALTLASSTAYATDANATKQLGTTGYKFTGFRLTASSAEDVTIRSIRLNQTGSVSSTDLANVAIVVNGTAYPATWSADGKYVDATFGSGVVVTKGNQAEIYIQGDIVGSNSSNRTVVFSIDKSSDIYATGNTYGYGAAISGGATATPYFAGPTITVTGASVTSIAKDTTVAAQNIAPNVPDQPLGGYYVDLVGEAVTVQSMTFTVSSSSSAGGPLTNVSIVDENGSVVAGPVDETSSGTLVFTDSVTYKTGKHSYTIRGKVNSSTNNGATFTVSTTPSSGWTNVKGEITGNSISLSTASFSMNTMTVKAAAISIGRASSPASQTITPGGSSVLMTNFQFDASQSGEDVRFASAPVTLLVSGGTGFYGAPNKLSSCQLFDGTTALNTGSNVLNPSTTSTSSAYTATMTLDNPVVVAKGTVKTLGMRCNISASSDNASQFLWDIQAASNWSFTGSVSGTTLSSTATDASDPTIIVTIGSGSTTVTTDSTSPVYAPVSAGSTDVPVAAYKFHATNEALNLTKLGLTLTNTASSSAGDLVKVTIWDGSTKVGEAYFAGSATTATSTFSTPVMLPKDQDKTLTIKADLANVGTSQAVTFSGHLLAINFLNAEGTGVDSGTTQNAISGSTSVAGVRIFKSFPTVAKDTLASTGLADGDLMHFKVTADAKGPISISEFNFLFATTSVTLSNVNVYGYTDSGYSSPISGVQSGGMISTTNGIGTNWVNSSSNFEFTAYNGSASTTIQIPAGQTRYFKVTGSVAGVVSGSSITTTLQGNASFVGCGASGATTNPLCQAGAASLGNTFVWSPNTTTTPGLTDADWTGAAGIPGLPSTGLTQTRSQ